MITVATTGARIAITISDFIGVETTRHEGEEAERIRAEARQNAQGASFL